MSGQVGTEGFLNHIQINFIRNTSLLQDLMGTLEGSIKIGLLVLQHEERRDVGGA